MAVANQTKTVVGIFNSVQEAENAVSELERAGIPRGDISLVAHKHAIGYKSDTETTDKTSDVVADAGIGAAIGGVGGLLLSAAGALTIPVIGPILAAGPIAAALTGAGVGAAAGGLIGALTESGIPEGEAKHYAEGVRRGDVLVTVKTDAINAERARDILDANGSVDVNDRVSSWQNRGWKGYDPNAAPYNENEFTEERRLYGGSYPSSPAYRSGSTINRAEDRMRDAGHSIERGAHRVGEEVRDAGRSVRRGASRIYDRLT